MKKRMNKKGQFYLLAAIIIITLIVGFATVSNYAKKKSSVKVYDLKDELNIESGKVLEYGTFSEGQDKTKEFAAKYADYAGENKKLYFIYGDSQQIYIQGFGVETGSVSLTGPLTGQGGASSGVTTHGETTGNLTPKTGQTTIAVSLEGFDYKFELKPGENFFFVISQEIEGEQHIVTS